MFIVSPNKKKIEYIVYHYSYPANTLACMQPEKPFKPMGILLWDRTEDNAITSLMIGKAEQLVSKLPTIEIYSPYIVADLKLFAINGSLQYKLSEMGKPYMYMSTCDIIHRINIYTEKPISEFCIWGVQQVG